MKHRAQLCLVVLLLVTVATAQTAAPDTAKQGTWSKLHFLLGSWTAAAKDTPHGEGTGGFSFEPQLNQNIVVRHNHAAYASGTKHDDLMIVYVESATPRAIYFDTEGHVIHYNLTFPAENKAVFESDPSQPGARYRLTYWTEGANLQGKFEVAPPGADYKTYLQWTSKRE
jgi:hypothetical protein